MFKIIIYGKGRLSESIEELIDYSKVQVVAYMLDAQFKKEFFLNDIPVLTPEELKISNIKFDYIIIATSHYDLMKEKLREIPSHKIIGTEIFKSLAFDEFFSDTQKRYESIFNQSVLNNFLKEKVFEPIYLCNTNSSLHKRSVEISSYDFVRYSTLEIISRKILSENIEGAVAELGVYKGDFAKAINSLFPQKKFYLFDTFEGFSNQDFEYDEDNSLSKNIGKTFNDTTVELVLAKMFNRENCVVKKGYFPETAIGLEEKFAFVSIDTDLFMPIYNGLKYFYPRLEKGGFIFVHDYLNREFKGAKLAVDKFCNEMDINFSIISDYYGTAIIAK